MARNVITYWPGDVYDPGSNWNIRTRLSFRGAKPNLKELLHMVPPNSERETYIVVRGL